MTPGVLQGEQVDSPVRADSVTCDAVSDLRITRSRFRKASQDAELLFVFTAGAPAPDDRRAGRSLAPVDLSALTRGAGADSLRALPLRRVCVPAPDRGASNRGGDCLPTKAGMGGIHSKYSRVCPRILVGQ